LSRFFSLRFYAKVILFSMLMQRVLVTGNLGYIGSVLTPLLVKEGYRVTGLDAGFFRDAHFVEREKMSFAQIIKDIRKVEASDVKGFDAIIHLAALSDDPQENLGKELMLSINFEATLRLARLAKKVNVKRFLFSSSCSVYGSGEGERFVDERSPLKPISTYAISKVKTEEALTKFADKTFCPVLLRNATCYGISPRMRFDLVLNNLMGYAFTTGEIKILSDGTPWRPLVHIEDVARAFIAMLKVDTKQVCGQTFNVGQTKENFQIKELAAIIARHIPNTSINLLNTAGPDKRSYRVNCDKIAAVKEFQPQWSASRYVPLLYTTLKQMNFSAKDFENKEYYTLAFYRMLEENRKIDQNLYPTS